MKKIALCVSFALVTIPLLACNHQERADSISVGKSREDKSQVTDIPRYKLYPTQDMWNFIKLDTRTGKMWQVQFSIEEDGERSECILSDRNLVVFYESEHVVFRSGEEFNGRFVLYPTQNIYNFILLDQFSGMVYQVQWSLEEEYRGIIQIYQKGN